MKKWEFVKELENNFEGRITTSEIKEILSGYEEIFDNGIAEGKDENIISSEIGSPAKIARNILEDSLMVNTSKAKQFGSELDRKFSEGADKVYDKLTSIDERVDTEYLANMGKRVGAYFIDALIFLILANSFVGFFDSSEWTSIMPLVLIATILGAFNTVGTFFVWVTNGFTPGKWILKIRVQKVDQSKITFWDAALREFLLKTIANVLLTGFLNLGSFMWACTSRDNKTVHDLCAKTMVINSRNNKIAPVKFNRQ